MTSLLAFVSGFLVAALCAFIAYRARVASLIKSQSIVAKSSAEASEKQRHMQDIVSAVPDTLMRVDATHRIVELKMATTDGSPSPLVKVSRRPLDTMFGEKVAESLGAAVDRSVSSARREVVEFEMRVRRELRHFEARVTSLGNGGALVVLRDVTEQKVMRAALERAREVAEADTRTRADFLAKMSHDLRNPMTGVIGMTDILLHSESDPRRRRRLEVIQRTGGYFVSIVNDILAFSGAEQGKLMLKTEPTELDLLAADVLDLAVGDAEPKHIDLFLHVSPALSSRYEADRLRLRQVVGNLVGNAVRFTDRGHVLVRIEPVDGLVEISIEDTGIGIPDESKDLVFDPFVQGEAAGPRRSGGAGLGLAVAKQLVTLMEGTIDVSSVVGRGSRFSVRLPLRRMPDTTSPKPMNMPPVVLAVSHPVGRAVFEAALARIAVSPMHVSTVADLDARLAEATKETVVLIDSSFVGDAEAAAEHALARPMARTVWAASALATDPPLWCPENHQTLQHPLRRASLLVCICSVDAC